MVIVRALQGVAHGRHDGQGFLGSQSLRLQELPQIHPIHKLHEQVVVPTALAKVIDIHDVRMIERRQCPGLFLKMRGKLCIPRPLRSQQLQSHQSIQGLLAGLVHHPHAAPAQTLDDLQLREVRSQIFWLGRRHGRQIIFTCVGSIAAAMRQRGQSHPPRQQAGLRHSVDRSIPWQKKMGSCFTVAFCRGMVTRIAHIFFFIHPVPGTRSAFHLPPLLDRRGSPRSLPSHTGETAA